MPSGLEVGDVALLACLACGAAVAFQGQHEAGRLESGHLRCGSCGEAWDVQGGLARLYREDAVRGTDRLMRVIYDGLPALHDPLTTVLTPLLQSVSEARMRGRYLRRLELGALTGAPARILEVGVGAGANLPLVRRGLPPGVAAEVWGVDLSEGMLGQCQRRLRNGAFPEVRLLMADGHALPFASGTFDRVLSVGGIGGYRDPARALSELARVAKPGTPVVVVDEQMDPEFQPSLLQRAAFRAITFYSRDPHCPTELLPEGATDVVAEQVSPFFYSLTFRMPGGASRVTD
ncbi:class I SAM-dependent methyltransferase [Myxococcus stipitatus]|uniref:class I SAM-dependent methyltransferase n=1 Tax=Myxococcus stipitatus TaxID=83455 RepID=UPI001F237DBC|nr:class I SAM-dependent methyltransferase [Myxococcus stipitatus]MCE9671812.1 class I SAM-dependent methyltransferase [Myxococcus stipitatus]